MGALNPRSSALSFFDGQFKDLLSGLRVVGKDLDSDNSGEEVQLHTEQRTRGCGVNDTTDKSVMRCSVCQVIFDSVDTQREHFKLDWHRFNLKQKLMGKPILSEDAFEETVSGELSSISGSDSDKDDDGDLTLDSSQSGKLPINDLLPEERDVTKSNSTGRQHPKLFFVSGEGEILSVYRSVLHSVKNIPANSDVILSMFTNLPNASCWIILMTAGGHFAGAVFKGNDVLTHKTFHRYTVRAKRGTAQGARDAQQGGKQPKSAGASLRRHNEAALLQEVQDLLEAWSQHVEQCDRIFIRTPAYNKSMFFGGKKPPFKKDDERIRTIPFATRRPTFNEVKRVHRELSSVQLLAKENDTEIQALLTRLTQRKTADSLPTAEDDKIESWQKEQNAETNNERREEIKSQENDDEDKLDMEPVARPQEASSKTKKTKTKSKRIAELELLNRKTVSPEQHLWNRLYCAVVSGNWDVISSILGGRVEDKEKAVLKHEVDCGREQDDQVVNCNNTIPATDKRIESTVESIESITRTDPLCEPEMGSSGCAEDDYNLNDFQESLRTSRTENNDGASSLSILEVINGRFGEGGDTLLHVASRSSQREIMLMLLRNGADPAVKDDKGRPPFVVACNKETRNEFRRFMASFPDRYDYAKAQIPSALTPEMEIEKEKRNAERKKVQKKAQKQRAKEQKALERRKEEEENEKKAFQSLSEREKRALAAEKRFTQQLAAKQAGISCCAWCGASLAGQVSFERLTYKYCSTACVKAHRLDMEGRVC